MTEIVLAERAPAVGKSLSELKLPGESLIAAIIRDGHTYIPRPDAPFEAADRLILIAVPQNQERVLQILTGEEA